MQPAIKGSFPGSEGRDQDTPRAGMKLPKNKTNFLKEKFSPPLLKKNAVSSGPGWPRTGYVAQDGSELLLLLPLPPPPPPRAGITGERAEPGRHSHLFQEKLPEQWSEEQQSLFM